MQPRWLLALGLTWSLLGCDSDDSDSGGAPPAGQGGRGGASGQAGGAGLAGSSGKAGQGGGAGGSSGSSASAGQAGQSGGATAGASSGGQAGQAGGAGTGPGGAPSGGQAGASGAGGTKGPAYDAGTAACPPDDGTRRIKLVNNCTAARWFKLDGRTTPGWARPGGCAWEGMPCGQPDGVAECTAIAKNVSGGVDPGLVYCKQGSGGQATCACNPFFELKPGEQRTIELPADAAFASGTGWLAVGCNALGAGCALGNEAAQNSLFEFTYDPPGQGSLYYDLSAVNAWTTASAVGMRTCGEAPDPGNVFWCRGTGCRFDVQAQCPDGTDAFAPAPAGCQACPTTVVDGKQVLAGSCGTCPDGHSGNRIPTGTVFNAGNVGGVERTWTGDPAFVDGFGHDEGVHANRRFVCGPAGCQPAPGAEANTCLGGCDLCTLTQQKAPTDPACVKYCCPDVTETYGGAAFRYDSAGCTAIGVQAGTDYSPALKGACPYVYTYGYEDHSSTFQCTTQASLLIQACPDPDDFPAQLAP